MASYGQMSVLQNLDYVVYDKAIHLLDEIASSLVTLKARLLGLPCLPD